MCEIGKPIEIIDVEPLKLPAPLQGTKNESESETSSDPCCPGDGDDPCREGLTEPAVPCPTPGTAWT